jgi:hypothetical protein
MVERKAAGTTAPKRIIFYRGAFLCGGLFVWS